MDAHTPATRPVTLIHLVPPGGGGVDRCVRDLLSRSVHDLIVHTTGDQCVLERQSEPRFTPCGTTDLVRHVSHGGVGRDLVLVVHGTVPALRSASQALQEALGLPLLLALHDVLFADPEIDEAERQARRAFARGATARMAPSQYILDMARAALGEDAPCTLVPWGAAPFADPGPVPWTEAAQAACGDSGFDGVVIGAVGLHKGLLRLEAVARLMPPTLRLLVVGYTTHQVRQGWSADGRLWVHGIFDPDQLPVLLGRYKPRLAFFPPGVAESHCYALSDAWMCGLSVFGPDRGAIAERIRRHGGGELYDPTIDDGALAAALVERLQSPARLTLTHPLPTLEDTLSRLDTLLAEVGAARVAGNAPGGELQALVATHLDGRFLRREVTDLQAACGWLEGELRQALQRHETEAREREQLHAALGQAHQRHQADAQEQARLHEALADAERQHLADTRELEALRAEVLAWRQSHERLVARIDRLLGWLPAGLRARLRQRYRSWRDR